ncbi:glycosyl hydrolase-related protein [bacterium]|nr:glycosyl hydrolase-related protein [bacterium]
MKADEIRERLHGCEILIVPYCHADWAWTHTRQWHVLRYVHAFERVLEIMRDAPGFRWYFDTYVTELRTLLDLRPDLLPELQQRVAEGRIAICGGFANVRPNMVGEETFVRSLVLGRRRFAALFPDADLSTHADIVDVALGHPQVPQLMKLGGYRYARFWRPQAGLTEGGVPYEWVWRGLDGSEVLCSRGCYGGLCSPDALASSYREDWAGAVEHIWRTELELAARHSPTGVLWVSQGMDDALPLASHGGDTPIDVPGFMAEWNRREQAPMRFATPVEFFAALEARRDRVPTVTGTLDPCDVCYNAAWAGSHGLWRKRVVADGEIVAAQLWQTLLARGGACPHAPDAGMGTCPPTRNDGASGTSAPTQFDALWENVLLFSAHATQWLFQRDFDELDELADTTILTARQQRRRALEALASQAQQPAQAAAVVFNGLPYARQEIVPVLLTHSTGLPQGLQVRDGEGRPLRHQVLTPMEYAGRIWEAETLVEVEVPACGYTTVSWQAVAQAPAEAGERAPQMDNGLVSLKLEGNAVAAVEWQGEAWRGRVPFGGLRLYDVDVSGPLHVGSILGIHEPQWGEVCVVEQGPLRWRALTEGTVGPHALRLETSLYAGQPRIEFSLTVEWAGHAGFLASLCPLPFDGTLEGDTPFGAEVKALDDIQYGSIAGHRSDNIERLREGMFYAKSFVSLSDGRRGVTYVSHDGDRYFIRDAQERSLAQILINSVGPITAGWEQHVNRQTKGRGRHEFHWSIILHEGDWRQAGMRQVADRLRQPVEVLLPGASGSGAPTRSLLSLEPAHVVLSALYEEDGAVLVRLWESEGQAAQVRLTLPWAPAAAEVVDFNGTPMDAASPEIAGQELRFALRPWEIVTLRLS